MTRYRQQVKRALRERAAENRRELLRREAEGQTRRKLRAGDPIPADAVVGEVFELWAATSQIGVGEENADLVFGDDHLVALVRWNGGPPAGALQVLGR